MVKGTKRRGEVTGFVITLWESQIRLTGWLGDVFGKDKGGGLCGTCGLGKGV